MADSSTILDACKKRYLNHKTRTEYLMQQKEDSSDTFEVKIVWFNAIGFLLMHVLGLYGMWLAITVADISTTYWVLVISTVSGIGVIVGSHRYYAHRTFKSAWFTRLLVVVFHTIAGQNCLYIWVRDHRQHHKYTDTNADPHNAKRGFFFSHIGWLMIRKHPDVIEKGKTIDLSDLEEDIFVMFEKRYYKEMYLVFSLILPVLLPVYNWDETLWNSFILSFFVRYILTLNTTWLVNSAAHLYGTRPYNKHIYPVESKTVSFFSMGEGFHNYHHCFPYDYRTSDCGGVFDTSTKIINLLERFGLVYDLKKASPKAIMKIALKGGDGSHPIWGFEDVNEEYLEGKSQNETKNQDESDYKQEIDLGIFKELLQEAISDAVIRDENVETDSLSR